ncbi:MAG: ThiF family adenylyltransferase [Bacillota bacterium]
MKNKICFIGCGGINSWAIANTKDVITTFFPEDGFVVTLFDNDQIEEKNLLQSNQNFTVDDLGEEKSEVLGKKYNFLSEQKFITEENVNELNMYDIIVVGVDNNKCRKLLYNYALQKNKILIDLRAQGTQIFYNVVGYNEKNDIEYYNNKYFNNEEVMERKGSCQLQRDVEEEHIENGNKIIASIGIYGVLLKVLRNEPLSTNEFKWVY